MKNPELLSTKQLPEELLKQAAARGVVLRVQEMIKIRPILNKEQWDRLMPRFEKGKTNVAFTSASSVVALKPFLHPYVNPHPLTWNIYCLSGKTREAIESLPESPGKIVATADDASSLGKKIVAEGLQQLVFFCGDQRRDELPTQLREAGIDLEEVVVYTTEERPVTLDRPFDGVLFFSPSGVRSYFKANQLNENTVCFAIGRTTAESLRSLTKNKIIVSERPFVEELLHIALDHFNQHT